MSTPHRSKQSRLLANGVHAIRRLAFASIIACSAMSLLHTLSNVRASEIKAPGSVAPSAHGATANETRQDGHRQTHQSGQGSTSGQGLTSGHGSIHATKKTVTNNTKPVKQLPKNAEDLAAEQRLSRMTQFLSSDDLGGRGLGTPGITRARDRIVEEFRALGFKMNRIDGKPFQPFKVTLAAKMGKNNQLSFVPAGENAAEPIKLISGENFNPLAIGGGGKFDLQLAFVGYGISAEEAGYDDYKDIDVQGKAVIILRHEPQQDNPHSAFNGTKPSKHAAFRKKVSNAFQHGATAVIFVSDKAELDKQNERYTRRWNVAVEELAESHAKFKKITKPTEKQQKEYREEVLAISKQILLFEKQRIKNSNDPLIGFKRAGAGGERRDLPVVTCKRAVIDKVLKAANQPSLAELEAKINELPQPASFVIKGWKVRGDIQIEREEADVQNIIAVLEGKGELANETVVVGAHYDHIGRGGPSSAKPGSTEIHNGADDNASGAAALLEIARQLSKRKEPLARRVVLIAFTGEERGLLGSAEYCKNPVFPLKSTVAMLNLDMVGRMRDSKLIISGTGTAPTFNSLIDKLNKKHGFVIERSPGGFGPSDHSSFYAKEIPVLHFFTGLHDDYHRPSDDFNKINVEGMRRVANMVVEATVEIANAKKRPTYVSVGEKKKNVARTGSRPYFGSIPQFPNPGGGYGLSGVAGNSPAAKAGLKAGDKIIQFGKFKIGNLEDFDGALRKFHTGDRVKITVLRDKKEVELTVILDPPK